MVNVVDKHMIVQHVSRLLKTAEGRVYIICPYIRLPEFLTLDLDVNNPKYKDIKVNVVVGKQQIDDETYNYFSSKKNVSIYFCKNLHSKIYLNDTFGVIASMNLYKYSIDNNIETGVYFSHEECIYTECFLKISYIMMRSVPYERIRKTIHLKKFGNNP